MKFIPQSDFLLIVVRFEELVLTKSTVADSNEVGVGIGKCLMIKIDYKEDK